MDKGLLVKALLQCIPWKRYLHPEVLPCWEGEDAPLTLAFPNRVFGLVWVLFPHGPCFLSLVYLLAMPWNRAAQ